MTLRNDVSDRGNGRWGLAKSNKLIAQQYARWAPPDEHPLTIRDQP
jgi:hypothetical protein